MIGFIISIAIACVGIDNMYKHPDEPFGMWMTIAAFANFFIDGMRFSGWLSRNQKEAE